jgi:hypothetical protein
MIGSSLCSHSCPARALLWVSLLLYPPKSQLTLSRPFDLGISVFRPDSGRNISRQSPYSDCPSLIIQSYGITISEETLDNLEKIYAINTTVSTDLAEQAVRVEDARLLMIEIVEDPVDESMSGTLWLFPSAVGSPFPPS